MSGFTYLTEVGLVDRLRAAPSKRPAINEFCFLVEEAADEIERLQKMIDHYEQALKAAFPQGATGMAFEHWNEARKLK